MKVPGSVVELIDGCAAVCPSQDQTTVFLPSFIQSFVPVRTDSVRLSARCDAAGAFAVPPILRHALEPSPCLGAFATPQGGRCLPSCGACRDPGGTAVPSAAIGSFSLLLTLFGFFCSADTTEPRIHLQRRRHQTHLRTSSHKHKPSPAV